jgi:hypothetical protein
LGIKGLPRLEKKIFPWFIDQWQRGCFSKQVEQNPIQISQSLPRNNIISTHAKSEPSLSILKITIQISMTVVMSRAARAKKEHFVLSYGIYFYQCQINHLMILINAFYHLPHRHISTQYAKLEEKKEK